MKNSPQYDKNKTGEIAITYNKCPSCNNLYECVKKLDKEETDYVLKKFTK